MYKEAKLKAKALAPAAAKATGKDVDRNSEEFKAEAMHAAPTYCSDVWFAVESTVG